MKNAFKNIRNTWTKIKPGCKLPDGVSHAFPYTVGKLVALYIDGMLDFGILARNGEGKPLYWRFEGSMKLYPLYPKAPAYWMKIDLPGEE